MLLGSRKYWLMKEKDNKKLQFTAAITTMVTVYIKKARFDNSF